MEYDSVSQFLDDFPKKPSPGKAKPAPRRSPPKTPKLLKIIKKERKRWRWPRKRVWSPIPRKKRKNQGLGNFVKTLNSILKTKKSKEKVHWLVRTMYTRGKKRFFFPPSIIRQKSPRRRKTALAKLKSFRWWKHSRLIQPSYAKLPRHRFLPHWIKPRVKTILQGIKHKKVRRLKARVFKRTIFLVGWKRTRGTKWYRKYLWKMDKIADQDNIEWRLGRIYVTFKHNNTFMTLTGENPSRVYYATNAGIVGYKGPKKATVFAREHVAKDVSEAAYQHNFLLVDLYLNLVGRVYWYLIKGLNEYNISVRAIVMKKQKAHGFIRPKKERRI
jgi:ribosomal protein S11